jgi:hypothetical protein
VDASAEGGNGEIRNVEVRYAGVVVGRAALVKELGPDAAFVGLSEPLPVGTRVTLKIGDEVREARVDEVVESAEPTVVGMRVRWGGAAAATRPAPVSAPAPTPPPAEVAAPPPAEVAAPPLEAAAPPPAEVAAPPPEAAAPPPAEVAAPPPVEPSKPEAAPSNEAGSSAAIAAPLSLASPAGDGAQPGGGKRRRKRR